MPVLFRLFTLFGITCMLIACTNAVANQALQPRATPTVPPPSATALPTASVPPTATPVPPSPTALPPTPTATPEPITGELALARGTATERLIAVLFDNHPAAYPQTGLDQAVLVFEAVTEYGITRYMGIFAPGISPDVARIGAVRSARLYFVQWAMGLRAVFVHAGGSPDGLELAQRSDAIVNMDGLRDEARAYFYRNEEREAPHNMYTTSADIQLFLEESAARAFTPTDYGFLFKQDRPAAQRPAEQRLDYYFIHADDPVGWVYDAETNGYYRLRRGKPHIDGRTEEQLWFKNVVLMEVPLLPVPDDDAGRVELQVVGEGRARTFIDGIEREVRWSKPTAAAQLRFYDAFDEEVRFNAGPVWIAAIPSLDNLTVE